MKHSIARQWVKALRSGKFKQGKGNLVSKDHEGKAHCCLGVLCAISPWKNTYDRMGDEENKNAYTPEKVMKWADLGDKRGVVPHPNSTIIGLTTNLTKLNDEEKFTFEQIADVIEKNYVEL